LCFVLFAANFAKIWDYLVKQATGEGVFESCIQFFRCPPEILDIEQLFKSLWSGASLSCYNGLAFSLDRNCMQKQPVKINLEFTTRLDRRTTVTFRILCIVSFVKEIGVILFHCDTQTGLWKKRLPCGKVRRYFFNSLQKRQK